MWTLDPITKKKLQKFRRIRRGWWSLWILIISFGLSMVSELVIGNRPLYVSYGGNTWFPAFTNNYHPETDFGGEFDLETDFRALAEDEAFKAAGGKILMPLHPFSPLESVRVAGDRPPAAPAAENPFGTDDRGRDIMARLLYGFRTSMGFALVLTAVSYLAGIALGAIQGFLGGWVDLVGQRLTEIWTALPFLYVVMLVSSITTPDFKLLVFILAAFSWIRVSRFVRAEVLRERVRDYAVAARACGASDMRILFKHVVPNSLTPTISLFPFAMVSGIFALTSLDFLGFGLPAPTPSWGELFQQARGNLTSWWLVAFPFTALFITLLLTTFVGEALREAWDPKDHGKAE